MFSVRIVTTDCRMDEPIPGLDVIFSEFRNQPVYKVPVVRIFGSTPLGQKTCLCLHGIFPYIYVALDNGIVPTDAQLQQFAASLDRALNVAIGRTSSNFHHVYKVIVVSGIPFYGYHAREQLFLKTFLYNPVMVKKVADLLLAGAVMNRTFQPHESHIPYVLQVFMDYNLFGMNFIHLSSVKFRPPVPLFDDNKGKQWNSKTVPKEMLCFEKKVSLCELEVDALSCHILNKSEISGSGNPGLLALWHEERTRCKKINIDSQLIPPLSPERCPSIVVIEENLKQKFRDIFNKPQPDMELNEVVSLSGSFVGEEEEETIVCEKTILDVVGRSENFREELLLTKLSQSSDHSFVNLLASLANDLPPSQKPKNLAEIEEWDSMLSQKSSKLKNLGGNAEVEVDDDLLVDLEMSQCFDPPIEREEENLERSDVTSTRKHKLSPNDVEDFKKNKKLRKGFGAASPLSARKLLQIKSRLYKGYHKEIHENSYKNERQRFLSQQENIRTEYTSLKQSCLDARTSTGDQSLSLSLLEPTRGFTTKTSNVEQISACETFPNVPKTLNHGGDHGVKLKNTFSNLINKLKDRVKEEEKKSVEETSRLQLSQPDVLECLAFLSSPDSYVSCLSTSPDPDKAFEGGISNLLLCPCDVESKTSADDVIDLSSNSNKLCDSTPIRNDISVMDGERMNLNNLEKFATESQKNSSNNKSLKLSDKCCKRTNQTSIEPICRPPSYHGVEESLVSGKHQDTDDGTIIITSKNAKTILNQKLIPSQSLNQLRFQAECVQDLTEYQSGIILNGINHLMNLLKNKAEVSGMCYKSNKSSDKHKSRNILAPYLDDDRDIYITPHVSPPTYSRVKNYKCLKISNNCLKNEIGCVEESTGKDQSPESNPNHIESKNLNSNLRDLTEASIISVKSSVEEITAFSDSNVSIVIETKKKVYSSTPFHRSSKFRKFLSMPSANLDITPIKKAAGNCGHLSDEETDRSNLDVSYSNADTPHNHQKRIEKTNKPACTKKVLFPIDSKCKELESQINAATPSNTFNFKVESQNLQQIKESSEHQYLCIVSLELHISTRSHLNPDPEFDVISAAFYHIHDNKPDISHEDVHESIKESHKKESNISISNDNNISNNNKPAAPVETNSKEKLEHPDRNTGAFILSSAAWSSDHHSELSCLLFKENLKLTFCKNELELVMMVIDLVKRYDADILVGYEVETLSWGYLIRRAACLNIFLPDKLSRFAEHKKTPKKKMQKETGEDMSLSSDIYIPGRIVLNLWRILRHETTLNIYTFENVAFHILHRRLPNFSFQTLSFWFNHNSSIHRWKTLEYYVTRCKGNLQIMEHMDLVGQTSEFARIFGIEFFDVLNRGSQYRVESMMLRLAKPQNFIAVSPSVQQRAAMKSPECIPLTLEPCSDFYTDPVIVLDFQSLYPSIMIAHNYCFSTCLGRLPHLSKLQSGPFEFGCTSLHVPPSLLESLINNINICSNGVAFVQPHTRKGILPQMVEEILNTRLMIKKAMKLHKNDKGLQRILHSRQLGLKLIANVTFGYTAANFSGRMACVEVGDSIMRKARDTLEAAISLVERNERWNAQVVYGDTDSMFVLLRGRTKKQAFIIGQEIADAVTKSNPKPVKLKLEKVYMPCVLQTKKRYVGFMYESADQTEPVFDAKGIETVRRDNCLAVSKILEKSLKILFTSCDLNLVKQFVVKQCIKILEGTTSLQDFIFAKEYRGMSSYHPSACIPALEIARRRLLRDRRSEPLVGERIPYVIVCGSPNLPLIKLVRQPNEVVDDATLKINSKYYLLKQILPPINRFTILFGVDVFRWYDDLPRTLKISTRLFNVPLVNENSDSLDRYLSTLDCFVCGELTSSGMCVDCKEDDQRRILFISSQIRRIQARLHNAEQVCTLCKGWGEFENKCISYDCPIFFQRFKLDRSLSDTEVLSTFLDTKF